MEQHAFVSILGLTSDNPQVVAFLKAYGVTRTPKLKRDDETAIVTNEKKGLEITFRDERYLELRSTTYEEGALVLSNVRMYGNGNDTFKVFNGELPFGLNWTMERDGVLKKIGKKPSWKNDEFTRCRWDFKDFCLFAVFVKKGNQLATVAVQLPIL